MDLPGDLRLVLTIDGDPRPSPTPETHGDEDFAEVDQEVAAVGAGAAGVATPKKSSNTVLQLAVIVVCLLGMAVFLTMDFGGQTAAADRPSFDGIVTSVLAKDKDGVARVLLSRLQYAQAALVRGNKKLALERFSQLRDLLLRQEDSLPAEDREDVQRMLKYVEYRLGSL